MSTNLSADHAAALMIARLLDVSLPESSEETQRAGAAGVMRLMDECAQSLAQQAATAQVEGWFSQHLHDTNGRLERSEAGFKDFKNADICRWGLQHRTICVEVIKEMTIRMQAFRTSTDRRTREYHESSPGRQPVIEPLRNIILSAFAHSRLKHTSQPLSLTAWWDDSGTEMESERTKRQSIYQIKVKRYLKMLSDIKDSSGAQERCNADAKEIGLCQAAVFERDGFIPAAANEILDTAAEALGTEFTIVRRNFFYAKMCSEEEEDTIHGSSIKTKPSNTQVSDVQSLAASGGVNNTNEPSVMELMDAMSRLFNDATVTSQEHDSKVTAPTSNAK